MVKGVCFWDEKIRCLHCDKVLLRKNLSQHNKIYHDGLPEKFVSTLNRSITDFVKKVNPASDELPSTSSKDGDGHDTDTVKVVLDDGGDSSDTNSDSEEPPAKRVKSDTENNEPVAPKSVKLYSDGSKDQVPLLENNIRHHLETLSTNVDKLIKLQTIKENSKVLTDIQKTSNVNLTESESLDVIKFSRSLDVIVKLLSSEFQLLEDGIRCTCCSHTFYYDLNLGTSFYNSSQPESFRMLKRSLCRHIETTQHIRSKGIMKKQEKQYSERLTKAKECAIHCASVAYTTFYFSESLESYEYHIADMYNSGGLVGSKNHSKNFPLHFLPHMYDAVKSNF